MRIAEVGSMVRVVDKWIPAQAYVPPADAKALHSQPVDSWQFQFSDGTRHTFVAAANGHIYRFEDSGSWSAITTSPVLAGRWTMARYGDRVYASAPGIDLQKWTEDSTTLSSVDNGINGAHILRAYKDFLVAFNFGSDSIQKVQWSGLDKPEDWNTDGDNSAGQQTLPDLGAIQDVVVFEDLYIFCDGGIVRMVLTGGDFIFQFDVLTRAVGVLGPGLVVPVGRTMYAATTEGFQAISVNAESQYIGSGAVDETYKRQFDPQLANKSYVFYDQQERLVRWSLARQQGEYPDTSFVYSLDSDSWGYDRNPHPVRFIHRSSGSTFADAAERFGTTFADLAFHADSFLSPSFGAGTDLVHGFDSDLKAGPASGAEPGSIETAIVSPVEGMGRVLVTGVRVLGTGGVDVATRTYETLTGSPSQWQDAEPANHEGLHPCFASGRYFQVRLQYANPRATDYLQGLELEWQRDGFD